MSVNWEKALVRGPVGSAMMEWDFVAIDMATVIAV
jgi:hypothetical protein